MFKFSAKLRIKRLLPMLLISLFTFLITVASSFSFASKFTETTHIFFSGGCADCWLDTEEVLVPTLRSHGLSSKPEIHDYNEKDLQIKLSVFGEIKK